MIAQRTTTFLAVIRAGKIGDRRAAALHGAIKPVTDDPRYWVACGSDRTIDRRVYTLCFDGPRYAADQRVIEEFVKAHGATQQPGPHMRAAAGEGGEK